MYDSQVSYWSEFYPEIKNLGKGKIRKPVPVSIDKDTNW